jgi:hypothetical protein
VWQEEGTHEMSLNGAVAREKALPVFEGQESRI